MTNGVTSDKGDRAQESFKPDQKKIESSESKGNGKIQDASDKAIEPTEAVGVEEGVETRFQELRDEQVEMEAVRLALEGEIDLEEIEV